MYIEGILYMITSRDGKGLGSKKNPDPDEIYGAETSVKRVIFIRHGESDWNDIFNKGFGISMAMRLFSAIIREITLLVTTDSVFLDSPLNHDGCIQARDLAKFLCSTEESRFTSVEYSVVKVIRGEIGSSVIVSSNLRRAIATTTIALWQRISKGKDKIHILSSLQEVSRNIDTRTLSSPRGIPDLSRIAQFCGKPGDFTPDKIYDPTENHGNKTSIFHGIKRLKSFNEWVFKRSEDTIIVGGHSLWFKNFFLTYLPYSSDHISKKRKISNSGVVAFDLHRAQMPDGSYRFRIEPSSILVLYGGFTSK